MDTRIIEHHGNAKSVDWKNEDNGVTASIGRDNLIIRRRIG